MTVEVIFLLCVGALISFALSAKKMEKNAIAEAQLAKKALRGVRNGKKQSIR